LKPPVFLQVDEYEPLDTEHPTHGALAVLKLDWQPPTQLPVSLASFASCAITGEADSAGVVGDT
jgi:hypothetical protein